MDPTKTGPRASWDAAWPPARLRRTSDATHTIFADPASRAFEERLALLAPTDATVLIMGETGTGKEVAARELHARSGRTGPFLAVNCSAMTETLAESELFGHEKGAFTGALKSQMGWFEAAAGGTLLLDEVGELPPPMQAKLLRVLQEREITRVGSRIARRIDARIVAATNVDLEAAVAAGSFRRDLLFRLAVATVTLRPLRERVQDIAPMAFYFLQQYGARFGRVAQSFAPDALDLLTRYDWPGNVRELDNVVHRAVLLTTGPVIHAADLSITAPADMPPAAAEPLAQSSLESALRSLAERWIGDAEPNLLQRATTVLVQAGFDAAGGNQVRAAELLGVTRNTLRTQLSHLGVIPLRRRRAESVSRNWVRVRIGTQKFGTSALLRVGGELEQRLAEKQILVDWRDFATGPPLIEAIAAGEIDIGSVGEVPPIFAQANGAPILYVACEQAAPSSVALVVREDSRIDSMLDLVGSRVALSPRANVHLLLMRALEIHGLTMGDIKPVYAAFGVPSGPASVQDADAWMMWDPYLSSLEAQGGFRILFDGTGLVSNTRFYVARRHFVRSLPQVVDTVLEEARRVAAEAAHSPTDAAHRLAGPFGMEHGGVERAMRRLAIGARALDETVMQDQQGIADHFYAQGLLPRAISVQEALWSR